MGRGTADVDMDIGHPFTPALCKRHARALSRKRPIFKAKPMKTDPAGRQRAAGGWILSARPDHPSGHRELPDVTHRVLRAMHEATDDGRGELGPSDAAKVAKRGHVDRAELRHRGVHSLGEREENGRDVRCEEFPTFQGNRRELLRRESMAAGVREQAIDDSGDVSHVKRRGSDASGAGIPLLLRQRLDDVADTFAHLQKNVRDRLKDVGNAVDGTALPPFRVRHGTEHIAVA